MWIVPPERTTSLAASDAASVSGRPITRPSTKRVSARLAVAPAMRGASRSADDLTRRTDNTRSSSMRQSIPGASSRIAFQ